MNDDVITVDNFNKKHYMSRLKKFFERAIFACHFYDQPSRKEIEKNFKTIVKTISNEIHQGLIFKDNYIKTYLQYIEGYLQYIRDYQKIINRPNVGKSIIACSCDTFLDHQKRFMEELRRRFVKLPCTTKIGSKRL